MNTARITPRPTNRGPQVGPNGLRRKAAAIKKNKNLFMAR
jgi:hypothetical protein